MAEAEEKARKEALCCRFQETVSDYLIRHQSILDIISKLQESSSRINRALVKSVTTCGCIKIKAQKQKLPEDISLSEMKEHIDSHFLGRICRECEDVLEEEMGKNLFYLAALCNLLNLNMEEVMNREMGRISTLGIFTLR